MPYRGRLLVATPRLGDPNFERTVVLVLDDDEDGTLGVVLNRPSGTDVGEHLPAVAASAPDPDVFFVGGPVGDGALVCLAEGQPEHDGWSQLVGAVGVLDLGAYLEGDGPAPGRVRVFAGYAGWGPGQLDAEVVEGSWFVVEARPDDVFCHEPGRLWRSVLERQGGSLARVAWVPEDLSVN